jgi:hypothetical protein
MNGAGPDELVAYFTDRHRSVTGQPAPRKSERQVKAEVTELIEADVDPAVIAGALDLMLDKRLPPSLLASLVAEAAAGPRTDRQHIADRLYRSAIEARRHEDDAK